MLAAGAPPELRGRHQVVEILATWRPTLAMLPQDAKGGPHHATTEINANHLGLSAACRLHHGASATQEKS